MQCESVQICSRSKNIAQSHPHRTNNNTAQQPNKHRKSIAPPTNGKGPANASSHAAPHAAM
eukprot:12936749-Alexandrium_andersonii.AAC.2